MSEFKGSKGNIKKDENLIFVDNYFQTHICKLVNVYNDEVTQANAELIVEAFDIRQQIPFSLTELKRQRDEMVEMVKKMVKVSDDGYIETYKGGFKEWEEEMKSVLNQAKQLLESATEIK